MTAALLPAPTRPALNAWLVAVVATTAFATRLVPVLRGHGLEGLSGYDGPVYYTAAAGLANGLLPYRDFLLLHPPGIVLALLPFAAVGRIVGHSEALTAAGVFWMALGAVNAVLVSRILRPYGRVAALAGGLFYAVFLPAIRVEESTTLETVTSLCLLGAMLLVSRPMTNRMLPTRVFVLAGVLLGLSAGVKIWGVVIGVAVVVWCFAAAGRRAGIATLLGSALGVTAVCLPFFLSAPSAMWRMVVEDQVGRRRVGVPWEVRLRDMVGLSEIHVRHDLTVLVLVLVAVAVGFALAALSRTGRLAATVFLTSWVLLVTSPSWSVDYASLAAPPLAVIVGAAAAQLLIWFRWRVTQVLVAVGLAAGLVLYATMSLPNWVVDEPFPGRELGRVLADTPGCVTSDHPAALIQTRVLQRNLDRGCVLMADLGGYSYDLRPGADLQVGRARNPQWQAFALDYLRGGDQTMIVRFLNASGYSPQTVSIIDDWPTTARHGEYTVRQPEPAGTGRR